MPKPKKGETEKDFLKRCIPELIEEENRPQRQAIAICYSLYRKHGTEPSSPKPKKKMSKKEKASVYCAVCN